MSLDLKERHQYVGLLARQIAAENEAVEAFSEQMARARMMKPAERAVPIVPALDVTLALESGRLGLAQRRPPGLDSLPFTGLVARPREPLGLPLLMGGPALVDAHPEAAWRSLWEARREPSAAVPAPASSTRPANLPGPEPPIPGEFRLAGDPHRPETPWQSLARLSPIQGLAASQHTHPDPSGVSAANLPVPRTSIEAAAPQAERPGPAAPTVPSNRSAPGPSLRPTRSGFGRLLPAPGAAQLPNRRPTPTGAASSPPGPAATGTEPAGAPRLENQPAPTAAPPQLLAALPWKRRPGQEPTSTFSQLSARPMPRAEQQPESPALFHLGLPTALPGVRLPVMKEVVEHLVQREVRVEIDRQRSAAQPSAEPPDQDSTPDFTSDEAVRGLMNRMQVLAQEDRFRLGRLP